MSSPYDLTPSDPPPPQPSFVGSGKSSGLPRILIEAGSDAVIGPGNGSARDKSTKLPVVVVSQPRRLAALALYRRALQMGLPAGLRIGGGTTSEDGGKGTAAGGGRGVKGSEDEAAVLKANAGVLGEDDEVVTDEMLAQIQALVAAGEEGGDAEGEREGRGESEEDNKGQGQGDPELDGAFDAPPPFKGPVRVWYMTTGYLSKLLLHRPRWFKKVRTYALTRLMSGLLRLM